MTSQDLIGTKARYSKVTRRGRITDIRSIECTIVDVSEDGTVAEVRLGNGHRRKVSTSKLRTFDERSTLDELVDAMTSNARESKEK